MKNVISSILVLFILGCSTNVNNTKSKTKTSNKTILDSLNSLKQNRDYFVMKNYYASNKENLSENDQLYFKTLLHNIYLNYSQSHEAFKQLSANNFEGIDSSDIKYLINIDITNLLLQGMYAEVALSADKFIRDFKYMFDSSEYKAHESTLLLAKAIKDKRSMSVKRNGEINIPLTRDRANLMNIDVQLGDSLFNLVFDTGANLSMLQRSIAEQAGMDIISADISVNFATGAQFLCDVAVADYIRIGDQFVENAVFIIAADSILTFPEANYEINGIIGFPIISALEEIHFTNDNKIFVPNTITDYNVNNLVIDELMPIILVNYNNDTLNFGFDTGARTTSLYSNFYNKYSDVIDTTYNEMEFYHGSGGGQIKSNGFILDSIQLSIAGKYRMINSIKLHKDKFGIGDYRDGNLGQDFMSQFDKMIISFRSASVVFE